MTRQDVEMAMIQLGKAVKSIVGAYDPTANHMRIVVVDGSISVSACVYDNAGEHITKHILDAALLEDGSLKLGGHFVGTKA